MTWACVLLRATVYWTSMSTIYSTNIYSVGPRLMFFSNQLPAPLTSNGSGVTAVGLDGNIYGVNYVHLAIYRGEYYSDFSFPTIQFVKRCSNWKHLQYSCDGHQIAALIINMFALKSCRVIMFAMGLLLLLTFVCSLVPSRSPWRRWWRRRWTHIYSQHSDIITLEG